MASMITDTEYDALKSLEQMYGLAQTLAKKFYIEEDAVTVKQTVARYGHGEWTIKEMLDRADEVLERAKARTW